MFLEVSDFFVSDDSKSFLIIWFAYFSWSHWFIEWRDRTSLDLPLASNDRFYSFYFIEATMLLVLDIAKFIYLFKYRTV